MYMSFPKCHMYMSFKLDTVSQTHDMNLKDSLPFKHHAITNDLKLKSY